MEKLHISDVFNLHIAGHSDIDFVDIDLNNDTRLFIDPCLIEVGEDAFSIRCQKVIQDYFECLCAVYSKKRYNPEFLAHLGERNEARLGYGTGTNGKAKTPKGMSDTLSGLHDLIVRGIPLGGVIDIPLMMPRFAEDCMSDMLVNVLYKQFAEFTILQCKKYGIKTEFLKGPRYYWDNNKHKWCFYIGEALVIDGQIILLVPKKYVSTRFFYSTSHFFMGKIATVLQKERTVVLNDKEIKPRKIDIKKSECMMYGSMVEATRRHTQYMPELLSDYHQNLKSEYQNRSMKDDELDRQVYFSHNTELIA